MDHEELPAIPPVGPSLRRAAIGALVPRRARPGEMKQLLVRRATVDSGRLDAYDDLCGFPRAATLPATYAHVLAFPISLAVMTRPGFPFPILGLVHIANRIEVLRAIAVEEPLDLWVRADNVQAHERGTTVDLLTTVDAAGAAVLRESSTYLRRHGGAPGRGRGDRDTVPVAEQEWDVTGSLVSAYARVSGDPNPIHTSALFARMFGFPHRIAHGMWTLARALAALGPFEAPYTVDARFQLPIVLPARVGFARAGAAFSVHDVATGRPNLQGTVS